MFSRLFALLPIAALVTVAAAAPNALEARDSSCDVSDQYCCDTNQLVSGQTYSLGVLSGLLSGTGLTAAVTCTPITVLLLANSGAQCTQQAVCCDNNNVSGAVNIACTPINVNV